jgi:hypothetical protein
MAYTTVSEVEQYLRTTYDTTTTPTLAQVTQMVVDVDAKVDSITGTSHVLTPDTQVFNLGNYTDELLTRKFPLNSVQSIYVNSGTVSTPVWTDEVTEYFIDDNMIKFTVRQYEGDQKLQVNYTYGFDGATEDVKELATLLVADEILKSDDSANNQFTRTRIGPIDTTRSVGTSRFVNLQTDITNLKKRVGSFKKINR